MKMNANIFKHMFTHAALRAVRGVCAFIIMQLAALLISMLLKRNQSGKLCMIYN